MHTISTLENFNEITYGRGTGNTTRLIDHAVQLLFEGKRIITHDPWENGNHENANEYLFERIIKRIQFEHPNTELIVNKRDLTLQIKFFRD